MPKDFLEIIFEQCKALSWETKKIPMLWELEFAYQVL